MKRLICFGWDNSNNPKAHNFPSKKLRRAHFKQKMKGTFSVIIFFFNEEIEHFFFEKNSEIPFSKKRKVAQKNSKRNFFCSFNIKF